MEEITFPFPAVDPNNPYSPPYNGHLWTIPIEFYGSFVVFLALLGCSRVRVAWRLFLVGTTACWALRCTRWDIFLFLAGTFLCEVNFITSNTAPSRTEMETEWKNKDLLHTSDSYQRRPISRPTLLVSSIHALLASPPIRTTSYLFTRLFGRLRTPLNLFLLITSLYLLSYAGDGTTPGTYHLSLQTYTPLSYTYIWYGHERFWLALGAIILIYSLSNSRALQKPFTTPFAQYLGDISYSLYIVHGLVLFSLGTHLQERWTGQVGESRYTVPEGWEYVVRPDLAPEDYGFGRYGKSFLAAAVINVIVVFWAADAFWRAVDGRVVKWGRYVEGWVA
jgi:hypothetical protein